MKNKSFGFLLLFVSVGIVAGCHNNETIEYLMSHEEAFPAFIEHEPNGYNRVKRGTLYGSSGLSRDHFSTVSGVVDGENVSLTEFISYRMESQRELPGLMCPNQLEIHRNEQGWVYKTTRQIRAGFTPDRVRECVIKTIILLERTHKAWNAYVNETQSLSGPVNEEWALEEPFSDTTNNGW